VHRCRQGRHRPTYRAESRPRGLPPECKTCPLCAVNRRHDPADVPEDAILAARHHVRCDGESTNAGATVVDCGHCSRCCAVIYSYARRCDPGGGLVATRRAVPERLRASAVSIATRQQGED
jgi:hypothetical protein